MRLARLALFLLFASLVHLPASARPACAQGLLRVNEIMAGPARDWDGSGTYSSRDDEWVELKNTSSSPLTLDGFFITDADSLPRYALSGVLAPGAFKLVTGKLSYDWEKLVGKSAVGLSLSNSGDAVMLWHVSGADTVLIDHYAFKSHEAAADRSVGRDEVTGEWKLFDGLDPYTGTLTPSGTGCAPTPGAANTCNTTPTVPTTWGRLKTRYR